MAFLGFIALIGVYVNHKIYFIDRYRELRRRNQDLTTAIRNAGRDRLRPVVLTALTAVLGLFPLTLQGGVLWSAFGWVNIFGLIASIPLSLILLPAFISLSQRIEQWWWRPRALLPIAIVIGFLAPLSAFAQEPPRSAESLRDLVARPSGLTADVVVQRVLNTSPQVSTSQAELVAAVARLDQALVGYLPQVSVVARYARLSAMDAPLLGKLVAAGTDKEGPIQPGTPLINVPISFPVLLNQYFMQATIGVPLSDYFLRVWPAHQGALHAREAAALQIEVVRRKAAVEAKISFYNWTRARLQVAVAAQAVMQARSHLQDLRLLVAVGRATPADTARIDSLVAGAELLHERAGNLALLLEEQLRTIMHEKGQGHFEIGEDLMAEPQLASDGELAELVQEAVASRSELRALEQSAQALVQQRQVAGSGRWPRVDLFGDVTYANPNPRVIPQQDRFDLTWAVGAQLSWSPNAVVAGSSATREVDAQAARLAAQVRVVRDGIRMETAQAYYDVLSSLAAIQATKRGLLAAEESYRSRQLLLTSGRATNLELTDAETELTKLRLEAVNALIDTRIAMARLQHAVGRN